MSQDLTIALALLTPKARQIWAHSRQSGDVSTFLTVLSEVVALTKHKGATLADGKSLSLYDALLQEYEPDASSETISEMFRQLHGPLLELRAAVLEKPAPPQIS